MTGSWDYEHVRRKKGCPYREVTADANLRRCPEHKMKLWPKARVRAIRFHDLRHTTASLLMMAGAITAAVQRILRPRTRGLPPRSTGTLRRAT